MKIEKNKIVFGSVIALVVIFIIAYSGLVIGGNEEDSGELKQTLVPELEQQQEDYKSKLDAINALKEVRETNAPSIYDEKLIDSMGFYDPDLLDKKKQHIVDSIYNSGRINYSTDSYRNTELITLKKNIKPKIIPKQPTVEKRISAKELSLEHQLFFASNPLKNDKAINSRTDAMIYAAVDGNQVVKTHYRLRMRLTKAATINGVLIPKNTPIYGFIKFQPNRAIITIENINHRSTKLKAFDLQDGSEGIYIENSFRAEATKEVVDDIIQDVNIAGVPQVRGLKKVFQRSNRNVKVTVINNYKLILKAQ